MNRIEKLLQELCPNGVEHKALGDIAVIDRGSGMPKTMLTKKGVGAIHYGQIYTHYGPTARETVSFVAPEDAARLTVVQPGEVVITNTSENLDDVCSTVAWLGEEAIVIGGHSSVIRSSMDPTFLAYWFRSTNFFAQKYKLATGAKVIDISANKLKKVILPVPPLEVQREIVTILDLFTELKADLEAELEAELEARRKQYEHYRDQLLTFPEDGGATWVELETICDRVISGGTPPAGRSEFYGGDIPWVRTQDVDFSLIEKPSMTITQLGFENSSAQWVRENSVIVAMYGATAAKVAVNGVPVTTNQACCNLELDSTKADHWYIFHALSWSYARLKSRGEGSQSNLNASKVKKFRIPLPELGEQVRIARMLNDFDALVNDLSSGLPAELEARRKQYEYYRDTLLTFKELEPEAA